MKGLTLAKWKSIRRAALRLQIAPHDLATVIAFETSGTFDPTIKNPYAEAYGLIQFTEIGLRGMGDRREPRDIAKLSFDEQIMLVEQYIKSHGITPTNLPDLYMLIFAPDYAGKAMSSILYRAPKESYTDNKWLDKEKKGYITKRDAAMAVVPYLHRVVKRIMELELE